MDDYVARTVRAYDDTYTYEQATKDLIPAKDIDKFLSYVAGNNILDAGCAYGRDTYYIASKGYRVQGIDLSRALIKRAKQQFPDLNFFVRDIRGTRFPDQSFDGIWCNATLLHLNDQDMVAALKEFQRILKNEGVLALSLKKGEGSENFIENFSSSSERYFNFKTRESFLPHLLEANLTEVESYYVNERERYGEDTRNLDWLYCIAKRV